MEASDSDNFLEDVADVDEVADEVDVVEEITVEVETTVAVETMGEVEIGEVVSLSLSEHEKLRYYTHIVKLVNFSNLSSKHHFMYCLIIKVAMRSFKKFMNDNNGLKYNSL